MCIRPLEGNNQIIELNWNKIKDEDRYILCNNRSKNGMCKIIKHTIYSGIASIRHCKDCKSFTLKDGN